MDPMWAGLVCVRQGRYQSLRNLEPYLWPTPDRAMPKSGWPGPNVQQRRNHGRRPQPNKYHR